MENNRENEPNGTGPPWQLPLVRGLIWAALFGSLMLWALLNSGAGVQSVPYSELKAMVQRGEVTRVLLEEYNITVVSGSSNGAEPVRAAIPAQGDPDLLPLLEAKGVELPPNRREAFRFCLTCCLGF
ncbi:ATP-dependent metallopeptidase FtsH/Yme1/Tma family protein [Leisingera sp. McT4-56]|uniref:ATP-dependent metallopeptidase FtsH/Yme1/Tma family protein n=1 Tax=Leisingera sp. McT4-56 TaxID=2881255 RepID=UPI001CF8CCBD|nr:ATP-dependent metallopeptidase FtsH/Yme1/Tma family protein [Leisingera sp. McT4-56]MCB4457863.1 ATP-dependent metallopeptidase FtsH/Yme1/Tma family protein [Leisingera sp. McT4-56]